MPVTDTEVLAGASGVFRIDGKGAIDLRAKGSPWTGGGPIVLVGDPRGASRVLGPESEGDLLAMLGVKGLPSAGKSLTGTGESPRVLTISGLDEEGETLVGLRVNGLPRTGADPLAGMDWPPEPSDIFVVGTDGDDST